MSDKPIGISGTRRQIRELVDGSLEVRIHIDPRFKADFHKLFPEIDMPVGIAPMDPDFERIEKAEQSKGGALCKLAAQWCKDPVFREWLSSSMGIDTLPEIEIAEYVRMVCNIESRSELDHDEHAAGRFNVHFRHPYMEFLKSNLKESNVQ